MMVFGTLPMLFNIYQGWRHMGGNIGCLDVIFSFRINGKRKILSFLTYSLHYSHYFHKSTEIFLSDDDYGLSTLCLHSRGLKIKPHFALRCQSNRRERERSVVTKVVDLEGVMI